MKTASEMLPRGQSKGETAMFKYTAAAGIALAGAFAVSGALAHESYGHSHYSSPTTTSVYSTAYTAPTVNLGPIEYVQPSSSVQYVQPSTNYIQPATASTYSAPVSTYTSPNYTTPSYAAQTSYSYGTPSYGTTYTTPTSTYGSTYTAPTYYTTPTYTAPNYGTVYTTTSTVSPYQVLPRFDATDRVRARMDRLRSRMQNATNRGDLRKGERSELRNKMRKIRSKFQAFRSNDGVIDQAEFANLNQRMSRQSDRIRRLAKNGRVTGKLVSPYGDHYRRY